MSALSIYKELFMRKFENQVQLVKYEILKKVSKYAFNDTLEQHLLDIPNLVNKGPNPRFRCCVYHERAVSTERIQMALGGNKNNPNLVEVLDSACDQCPTNRFTITESCRGCLSHRCALSCPKDAIYIRNQKAHIDYSKCIECGKCKKACPYNSIIDTMRPCQRACPTNAISINDMKKATISFEDCIQCGACVYQCPFGAIQDKSEIVDVIKELNKCKEKKNYNLYAVLAPSFSTQFNYIELEKVVKGLKTLGFKDVVEVSLGADLVTIWETEEFKSHMENHEYMTTSCCPSFLNYAKKNFPEEKQNISSTISPMIAISQIIKEMDLNSKVVFIGPCIAKKGEKNSKDIKGITDYVLTFEELSAMLDSKNINLEKLIPTPLNNSTETGRGFAASGGVAKAIKNYIDIQSENIEFKPVICSGIPDTKKALTMAKIGKLNGNFIEAMACQGGCIKGPVTMHYGHKDKKSLEKYSKLAKEKNPELATEIFDTENMVKYRKI